MISERFGCRTIAYLLVLLAVSEWPTGGNCQLIALSKADKQVILDTHNVLRARTARGETGKQPTASDMMLLEWDDRLMVKAASWAAKCQVGHDTAAEREIPGHKWVGQNWAGGYSKNLSSYVDLWYEEHSDYTYETRGCTRGKMCGHYTQVVWSRTLLVGCGLANCPVYPRVLVCNYADGGNVGNYPTYDPGAPASKCIGEYAYTMGDGLCLRKDQCANMYTGGGQIGGGAGANPAVPPGAPTPIATTTEAPTVETTFDPWGGWTFDEGYFGEERKRRAKRDAKSCRCALQCLNGGTLDSANCRCACTPDHYGTRCELTCSDPEMFRSNCESDPEACKTFGPIFCPKTCKGCKTAYEVRDKAVVNEDGVVARLP